jgi:glutathione S-transferase
MIRFCPYAQRTVLVLNAKQVNYNIINSALMDKPAWLLELNPLGSTFEGHNNIWKRRDPDLI